MSSKRFFVMASLLAGCATAIDPHDGSSSTDSEIVGGTADDEHHSTALIRFVRTDDSGQAHDDNCTGSLVAPDIVLTAGHCVVGSSGRRHSKWKVSFEAATEDGEMVNAIDVEEALPHPEFDGGFGRFDVALLHLARKPALRPMKLVESLGDITGEEITFVGYGAVGTTSKGDQMVGGNDRRRQVAVRVSATSTTFIEYVDSKGLCGGDSGGPTLMLIGGEEVIVGLNDLAGVGCNSNGASVRVDDEAEVRDFLAEHITGVSKRKTPSRPDDDDPCKGCDDG